MVDGPPCAGPILVLGVRMLTSLNEKGALFARIELSPQPGIQAVEREELFTLQMTLEDLFSDPRYRVLGEFDGEEWDPTAGHCTLYFYGEVDRIERVLQGLLRESPFVGRISLTKHYGEDRENGIVTQI
jgi:hypothetical protein